MARDEFANNGLDVSMDKIAKAAGVGAGTLYRHFPNRELLFGAVLEGCAPNVAAEGARLESADDAAEAVERWLAVIAEWSTSYDGAAAPMRDAINGQDSPLTATCDDMVTTLQRLLDNAQRTGAARAGVDARELYLATLGMSWAAENGGESTTLLALLRRGWAAPPHSETT
ncbi:TetR family transcriptional regulator [Corynebacterium sp. c25Ua_47]|uniref:TetR/AcrR family transcriptional regulator n=1 Tax=Corynebacterium sp. c25Ua_47 TaxID=3032353 RepID=UPI00215522DE